MNFLVVPKTNAIYRCPSEAELRLSFDDTLFGQLYSLIGLLNERWMPALFKVVFLKVILNMNKLKFENFKL